MREPHRLVDLQCSQSAIESIWYGSSMFMKGVLNMNENSYAKIAGNTLRNLIKENYVSQEEFAYDFGVDIRTLSRYINNGINRIDTIQELASFLGVDFMTFFKE